jgi:hypothetical protein
MGSSSDGAVTEEDIYHWINSQVVGVLHSLTNSVDAQLMGDAIEALAPAIFEHFAPLGFAQKFSTRFITELRKKRDARDAKNAAVAASDSGSIVLGRMCDGCRMDIDLTKLYYYCGSCQDYDLCLECVGKTDHVHEVKPVLPSASPATVGGGKANTVRVRKQSTQGGRLAHKKPRTGTDKQDKKKKRKEQEN